MGDLEEESVGWKQVADVQNAVETQAAEARATSLALELRRLYMSLPEVVQQKLTQTAEARAELQDNELEAIRGRHREEHFKFMQTEELLEEKSRYEEHIDLATERNLQVDT